MKSFPINGHKLGRWLSVSPSVEHVPGVPWVPTVALGAGFCALALMVVGLSVWRWL
jgi:hypothetical protein